VGEFATGNDAMSASTVRAQKFWEMRELSVGEAVAFLTGEELLSCLVRKCGRFL
jgi:hypothetical protein